MHHLSPSDFSLAFQQISGRGGANPKRLAQALGLEPSELERVVAPLSRNGLLTASEKTLRLNPAYGRVVAIDMGASHLHFGLSDYSGKILLESDQKIPPEEGPRKITERIKAGIRSVVQGDGNGRVRASRASRPLPYRFKIAPATTLRAVAIGVPSPVDVTRGEVSFANNLPGWRKIPLRKELEDEFRVPVFLENDANMAALGEHWRGAARGVDSFVFIALGTGIGSGIFVDGRLVRGKTGAAGEVHLMNLEWQRWNEDFGDVGYFETHVSGMGIASEGRKILNAGSSTGVAGLASERDARFVFESMSNGSARARELLERIFTMLGVGVADMAAVLDPEMVVFGGGIVSGAPEFLVSTVERVVKRIQENPPKLRISELQGRAQIYGAIYSALRIGATASLADRH
jgi:predicted NBD/HSP70 family sugar kinase